MLVKGYSVQTYTLHESIEWFYKPQRHLSLSFSYPDRDIAWRESSIGVDCWPFSSGYTHHM